MKNVMNKAWEIAKSAAAKFGGRAAQYFAQALKMAWEGAKEVAAVVEYNIRKKNRFAKVYLAKIVGKCERFGLAREFVKETEIDQDGWHTFHLADGLYEVCENGKKEFIEVEAGEKCFVNAWRLNHLIANM